MVARSLEEQVKDSWLFKAYEFSDSWELPVVRDALKNLVARKARSLVHKADLSFLREDGHHTDAVLQQRDVEASTRLEKMNHDLVALKEREKALERRKRLEESRGNLF